MPPSAGRRLSPKARKDWRSGGRKYASIPALPHWFLMATFEIRLVDGRPHKWLLFMTARETDTEAVRYARLLLERHPEFYSAEIWKGMKMVRQI